MDVPAKYQSWRNLPQYKDLDESEFLAIVQEDIKKEEVTQQNKRILEGLSLTKKEEKEALDIISNYKQNIYIESTRQEYDLKDLVFIEIEKSRARRAINKIHDKDKDDTRVPTMWIDALNKLIDKGQQLAQKLFGSEEKDDISVLQQLFKKFRLWMQENQGTRSIICASCSKMLLLKIRADKYDVTKHPFFKDRLLTNEFLMEKYLEGKPVIVDEKFIANVLGCSVMYTEWYLKRHFNKNNPKYQQWLEKHKDVEEKQE